MIWARRGLWPKMRSKTVNRFPCYPHPFPPPPDLIFSHILNQCALYGLIENTMWGSNKRIERGLILLIWIRHLSNVSSALMNVFWMSLMGYVNKTGKGGFQRLACKKMVTSCLWFPGRWRSVGGGGVYKSHLWHFSPLQSCRDPVWFGSKVRVVCFGLADQPEDFVWRWCKGKKHYKTLTISLQFRLYDDDGALTFCFTEGQLWQLSLVFLNGQHH